MANRKVVPGFIVLLLSPPSFTSFFVLFVLSVHYDGHYDQDNNSWPPEAQKLHDYLSSHTCSFDHFVRIHFCPSRLCRSSSGGRPDTSRSFWPASLGQGQTGSHPGRHWQANQGHHHKSCWSRCSNCILHILSPLKVFYCLNQRSKEFTKLSSNLFMNSYSAKASASDSSSYCWRATWSSASSHASL